MQCPLKAGLGGRGWVCHRRMLVMEAARIMGQRGCLQWNWTAREEREAKSLVLPLKAWRTTPGLSP